jgi:hypothetical protein
MADHVVGTYNMSFMSDFPKYAQFASEYLFLNRDVCKDNACWDNAVSNLLSFIQTEKPLAIGLQEINLVLEDELNEYIVKYYKDYGSKGEKTDEDFNIIFLNSIKKSNVRSEPNSLYRSVMKYVKNNGPSQPSIIIITENDCTGSLHIKKQLESKQGSKYKMYTRRSKHT